MKKIMIFLLAAALLTGCSAQAVQMTAPMRTPGQLPHATLPTTPPSSVEDTVPVAFNTTPTVTRLLYVPDAYIEKALADNAELLTVASMTKPQVPHRETTEAAPEQAPQQIPQTDASTETQKPSNQETPRQETPKQEAPKQEATGDFVPSPYLPKPTDNPVLRLPQKDIRFMLGKEVKVTAEYTGSKNLRWYTSSATLKMDIWGILTATKVGTYTLYVTDGVYAASTQVTVTPVPEPVGDIWFENPHITMMERTTTLAEVKGDTPGEYVTYVSSDPTIVEASGGFLMAQKPGTATITATHRGRKAVLTVTVTMDPQVERLILDQTELKLFDDDPTFQLTWYYSGRGTLRFKSSDPNVALVNQDGVVVPVGVGECEIFVSDNMRGQGCKVTVVENPDKVYAEKIVVEAVEGNIYDGMVLQVGDIVRFRAYAVPVECKNYVTVENDNWNVAWIDWRWVSEGVYLVSVCCNEPGTTTLTVISEDGCASVSYRLTVEKKPQ